MALQYLQPTSFEKENHPFKGSSQDIKEVAHPEQVITNSKSGEQISSSTQTWTIQDFDLSFDPEFAMSLPRNLYTYRISFITDESMQEHEVSLRDLNLLAGRLNLKGEPLLIKPGDLFRGFYSTHSRWFVGDPAYGMPFLDVDISTGSFDYSSGKNCARSNNEISIEEARNNVIKFVRDRNLVNIQTARISVLGPRKLNETFRNCFVVFFINILPIDNKEIKKQFDLYSTQEVSLPASYNSRGFPHDGLSVSIDPSSGEITYIHSEYLRLTPIENLPSQSLGTVISLLKVGGEIINFEDSIYFDIGKPETNALKGKIKAVVKLISPYYIEEQGQDIVEGRIGATLEPFYYAIAVVPVDPTTSPYSLVGHLLIRVPAKKN